MDDAVTCGTTLHVTSASQRLAALSCLHCVTSWYTDCRVLPQSGQLLCAPREQAKPFGRQFATQDHAKFLMAGAHFTRDSSVKAFVAVIEGCGFIAVNSLCALLVSCGVPSCRIPLMYSVRLAVPDRSTCCWELFEVASDQVSLARESAQLFSVSPVNLTASGYVQAVGSTVARRASVGMSL
jgi:hypothetical protein